MSHEQTNPTPNPLQDGSKQSHRVTRPTSPQQHQGDASGEDFSPDLDEGPRPGPVDDIQNALFDATRQGASTEVNFDALPKPGLKENPARPKDEIQNELAEAARKGVPADVDFDELPEPLPELDEGPHSGPVDEIQGALFAAAQQGAPTELDLDELPKPLLESDEGPRPGPVDEIQDALLTAAQAGVATELSFDELPAPSRAPTRKVIRFKQRDTATKPSEPVTSPESVPLPEFSEPEPEPAPLVADFWLLLTLFVSFRGLTLWLFRPGGFIRDWSDFDTYLGIATASDYGQYPFLNFWLEWPPLLPWLAVGAYKLSLLLPPWPDDPRLWFIIILGAVFVLFEVGNFVLIYRLARRLFQNPLSINRVLWLYAGLFPPVYAMLGFFDGVALFFMLLALELLLADRRFPSAIAVGVGFMVKIIPILMLPVALRRLWDQYRHNQREAGIELGLYAVAFGLTVMVLLGPFLIGGPEWVRASARSMVGRSSWETVWAVAEGYYGFGQVAGDRTNPDEMNFAVHTSDRPGWFVAAWWLANLVFVGLYALIFTRPADYRQPRNLIALSGLTVAIFLLYNKGYSPQFLVYLLPFIILLFPDGRGLIYALVLTGLNILEQPIYFVLLPTQAWLLVSIVIARFLVIGLLALEFVVVLWPTEARLAPVIHARPRVPHVLAGLALLAGAILIPVLLRIYTAEHLAESPAAAFVSFMEVQRGNGAAPDNSLAIPGKPRLLLSDQATYRQLYPYLNGDFDLQLAGGVSQGYPDAPKIVDLLQGFDRVWVLPTGPQQQALSDAVSGRGQALASFDFAGLGTASLYGFEGNLPTFIPPARFSNGMELLTYEVEVQRGAVDVILYWRALEPQTQNLTVFTHLLNADGEWIAGHDSIPANGTAPTTDWPLQAVQVDPHRIVDLPPGLPAGEYLVMAGLYNDFQERLRSIDPQGFTFPDRAVPLGVVRLP